MIIRPKRNSYAVRELGEPRLKLGGDGKLVVKRTDSVVVNSRGHAMQCSHWEAEEAHGWLNAKQKPCVIYLHGNLSCKPTCMTRYTCSTACDRNAFLPAAGNSSSRLAALELLPIVIPIGASLFGFDFSGCGNSDGDHVSLGVPLDFLSLL